jgi:hypothetical protein
MREEKGQKIVFPLPMYSQSFEALCFLVKWIICVEFLSG